MALEFVLSTAERKRREADRVLKVYNELRQGSASFHLVLRGVTSLDYRRIMTIDALLRVCPHANLALLNMLLKDVIKAKMPRKFCNLQQKRIEQRNRKNYALVLNVTAVEPAPRSRLLDALMTFQQIDDDRIVIEAMAIEFPEFDDIEVDFRHRFITRDSKHFQYQYLIL